MELLGQNKHKSIEDALKARLNSVRSIKNLPDGEKLEALRQFLESDLLGQLNALSEEADTAMFGSPG